jgi:hypothetical protein
MVSNRNHAASLAALGLAGLLSTRPAPAAERACPVPTIETDARVREQWPELSSQIGSVLRSRADIDACARIALSSYDGSLLVEVTLPDGRRASRVVSAPEDVVPSLEALLLVPEVAREQPPREPATDLTAQSPTVSAPRAQTSVTDTGLSSIRDPHRVSIELSLTTGAGFGAGQVGVSLGALTLLEVNHWLFGFQGRAANYQALSGGPSAGALELALLAGRRLPLHSLAVDLITGPGLALQGSSAVVQAGSTAPPVESNGVTPRLFLGSHLVFGAHSVFRGFVGIDGEIGLTHSTTLPRDSGRLPAWSAGFALGATLGTQ